MSEETKEDLDFTPVTLSRESQIVLSQPFGVDEVWCGSVMGHVNLDYPSAGISGGRFIVSPSENLVIVAMFSGQSEERFDLLDRRNGLKLAGGLPYVCGYAASYGFSPDESVIVMATANNCPEWWQSWEDGETEVGSNGEVEFDFGTLHCYDVKSGNVSTSEIVVRVSPEWQPVQEEYDLYLRPRFASDTSLELKLPWGSERIAFPPSEPVIFQVQ